MRDHLITSTHFFQDLLSSYFQRMTQQIVETLVLLCVCHLFGLYNPNQVADAIRLSKGGEEGGYIVNSSLTVHDRNERRPK